MTGARNWPHAAAAAIVAALAGIASCRPAPEGRSPAAGPALPAPQVDGARAVAAPRPPAETAPREAVAPLPAPEPRPGGYVGSQACAACHAAINESFAAHPMGRSMDTLPPERLVEGTLDGRFVDREREYSVETRDGVVLHRERTLDADGVPIYDQAVPMRFAVGSGTRGRSYLAEHGGVLFQSPIGWYTATGRYGISPGYENDRSLRFERIVGDGCLHCHAGRVDSRGTERYSEEVFLEASIGCERCHGPGAAHVAAMEGVPPGTTVADMMIVNPADLEPRRREAVCNQCHLGGEATIPRFGRGFDDFRPGDLLDDTMLVFVHDESARSAVGEKPVSQVEQMRQSRCFIGSGGTLGCTSCHDPHAKPAPARLDAFYRTKCDTCHQEKPCSLPQPEREAPPASGSCIACHMPSQDLREVAHTAMTDHRVPRRPEPEGSSRSPSGDVPLVAFDGAAERVPRRELERGRGLALAARPGTRQSTRGAIEAVRAIVPRGVEPADTPAVVAALDGDVDALRALGALFSQTGRADAAAACWEAALRAAPQDAESLTRLAIHNQRSGRLAEALAVIDRVIAGNDRISSIHAQAGALRMALGRPDEAVAAVRRSLELDPTSLSVRSFLVELLAATGRAEEAEEERKTVSRLKAAAAAPFRAGDAPSADSPRPAAGQ